MRDDFSESVKRSLGGRVAWKCSYPGCPEITVGPGNRDDAHVLNLGVAAHITAASPGGPRYDPDISSEERASIQNGIWLCKKHSELIDKDFTQFSADTLRQWKAQAEKKALKNLTSNYTYDNYVSTLISIGSSLICEAEWLSINLNEWKFKIGDFVLGSNETLINYALNFNEINVLDKYLIFEKQGDGRILDLLKIDNKPDGLEAIFHVRDKFPAQDPNQVSGDIAIGDDFDISFEDGDFKLVTGKEAAKQSMRLILSSNFGDLPYAPSIGSFFSKYYQEFRFDKIKLGRMLKLEITRLLTIPVHGGYPPSFEPVLPFIKRVNSVEIIDKEMPHNQTPVLIKGEWGNGEQFEEELGLFLDR